MTTTIKLDRERVLAHRAAVQDLTAPRPAAATAVLGIGIQDAVRKVALVGFAARSTMEPASVASLLDRTDPLSLAMLARGAPHVFCTDELDFIASALVPLSPAEAAAVAAVATVMRSVADGQPVSRPELSGRLNDTVPDKLRAWCEPCGSRHVLEGLFRKATLQAGFVLDPDQTAPVVFEPMRDHPPSRPDSPAAGAELAHRFLRLVGAGRNADLAAWLGYRPGETKRLWEAALSDSVVSVQVGSRTYSALTSDIDALREAEARDAIHLLPPLDPYLLGDRELVVPDRAHQRQVWRSVANPGVILRGIEVVGTWRQRMTGDRLGIRLTPFGSLTNSDRRQLQDRGERVAAVRCIREVDVAIDS